MRRTRLTLLATILGSSIVFLDSSVVNVALPRIGRDLPAHLFGVLEGQTYVYNAYLLTLSTLLILAGVINDNHGRRRMFAVGLIGFGVSSVLCGLAPNIELLVAFRVLQGAPSASGPEPVRAALRLGQPTSSRAQVLTGLPSRGHYSGPEGLSSNHQRISPPPFASWAE